MKLSQFSLLALIGILFVGCSNPSPFVKEDIDDEVMEEMEEMMEDMEEMMDDDEMEDMDDKDEMMDDDMDDKDEMMDDDMDDKDEMKEDDAEEQAAVEKEEPAAAATGKYVAYQDGVIGNGEKSVLFFHAKWCPACKKNEALLTKFYGAGEYPISVYKVDYDTSAELKAQFGVVSQDTFVVIDGDGNVLSSQTFPTEAKLKSMISL